MQTTNRLVAGNLAGGDFRDDPVYQVSNLGSLFSVCAAALEGASIYREDIRERLHDEIRLVLQLGAVLTLDVATTVDNATIKQEEVA